MSTDRSKYVIVYKDFDTPVSEAAKLIGANVADVHTFSSISRGLVPEEGRPVHFDEIGVTYAWLTEQEAAKIRLSGQVSSIRKHLPVQGGGRIAPIADVAVELGGLLPPWNISLIGADEAWARSTGTGVKVAVLDSGITNARSDLPVAGGVSFVPGVADWNDDHGHGTACAGIIGTKDTGKGIVGVAYDCSLYAVKVLNNQNSGDSDWTVAGLMWAKDQGMHVVSMSLWLTAGAATPDEPAFDDIERAAQVCLQAGCLVVGIVGNSGAWPKHWVANYGRCPSVVGTGAVDANKAWWDHWQNDATDGGSSYGPPELPPERAVELVAPGVDVLTAGRQNGQKVSFTGTSTACPHVAAAAALLKAFKPALTPAEIRQRLTATAEDLGPAGRDDKFGFGLLNCRDSVV